MFVANSIIKVQKEKFFGIIIWKCLIDYMYSEIITDIFAYMNNVADYNYGKLMISWGVVVAFFLFSSKIQAGMLKFSFEFMIIMSLIPTLTVWWVRNDDSTCMCYVLLYWAIWGSVSYVISQSIIYKKNSSIDNGLCKGINQNYDGIQKSNRKILILFIGSMISTLHFSYKYGNCRLFIALGDVYKYRMVVGNNMPMIEVYWYGWISQIVLPILLLLFLLKKRIILALICSLLISMNYSIYGNKSILFMVPLVICFVSIQSRDLCIQLTNYVIWGLDIVTLVSCFLQKTNITRWGVALVDRLTTLEATGHFYYYDFFQNSPFLFLSQSLFKFWKTNVYELPIGVIIGSNIKYNPTGNYNNFNNGVFSDAYANFGVFGVIIYPVLYVVSIYAFEVLLRDVRQEYKYLLLVWLLLYCMSIGYFQWLLSGGYLFIVIGYQISKRIRA